MALMKICFIASALVSGILLVIFEVIRSEFAGMTSKFAKKIKKLCKIGVSIVIPIMFLNLLFAVAYLFTI